jgi:hypothetical protein
MADTQDTGTLNLRYPTDYNISTLSLITPINNGVINLLPALLELSLYEDLFGITISGEILLQDTLGIISNYTLSGSEFLQVVLKKTSVDEIYYTRNFRVYKVGKRVTGDTNAYEVFSLMFCSEEFMLSEQYRISKSFKGKEISKIVKSIFTDYLKIRPDGKAVFIQDTLGIYDFVLPNKKIFETINWLATYCKTQDSDGDMLFFENSKGFYFVTLSSLFSGTVYNTYKFDPKNTSTNMNQMLTNVSDFEVLNFYDTLAGTKNGTFANKVISLDVLQRKINTEDGVFNYKDYFNKSKTLNDNPVINDYTNRLGGKMYEMPPKISGLEAGCLRLAVGNAGNKTLPGVVSREAVDYVANDIRVEQYLPNRVGKISVSNYMRIKVSVPGDPNLAVGKVVNFETFQMGPEVWSDGFGKGSRKLDPLYSGKYIITAIRHIVKKDSYITVMELCKDSHTGYITGASNGSMKNFINGVQING